MPPGADDDHVTHCIQFTMDEDSFDYSRALRVLRIKFLKGLDLVQSEPDLVGIVLALADRVAALETPKVSTGMTTEDLFVVLSGINDMDRMSIARHLMRHPRIGPLFRGEQQQAATEESSAPQSDPAMHRLATLPAATREAGPLPHTGAEISAEEWDALKERLWALGCSADTNDDEYMISSDFSECLDKVRVELSRYARPTTPPAATREAVDPETNDAIVLKLAAIIRELPDNSHELAEAILYHPNWPALLPSPTREAGPLPKMPTLRSLLYPAYEPGDGSADGAQLVDGEWWHPIMGCDSLQEVVGNARAVLARWGGAAVLPVEVSDGWPEFSDCDDFERVHCFNPVLEHWKLNKINPSIHTHLLPHWALPVPAADKGEGQP